ncbi:4-hydroxy-tetrahydrodipicolinate synthase [Rubrivirga sp. S365]|uniref:4-hydroxy-tetrahydrodipicolinate synthase n=1 Tax=Rubrivirga litoralis TaxID=3075598 RepID=A0ABU3BV61_9BACT|nr:MULTISPECIES: 4-hydroxy-tetrahydrodipicolinate synthase [unclassified Rubrivirga]MDT0633180.1 4-hydroxy-tetrahydrodipicolinate synthase [Rubrivirga sp. F394]MDT7857755.1 4-hydroxy-tetrahydrodipicolinate synthase [Rubrivirga sp. S365]
MGPTRQPVFRGTAPALVTPFAPDGEIDEDAFRRLIDVQIQGSADAGGEVYGGVEALVVLGTTGENPTVTDDERRRLVEIALEHTAGRVPVVVGTGTNSTAQSARYSREAADAGADGLLVVGPYYSKPTPDGVLGHVAAVADATDCPIVLYNVPGRTGSNLTAETQLRVTEAVPSVVGLKEASGDLGQIADVIAGVPDGVAVYSGDDDLAFPTVCLGGAGLISVIANAAPGPISEMVRRALADDVAGARALHYALLDAMRASFFESNPAPVKAVLAEMGRMSETLRLPLAPLTDAARRRVLAAYAPLVAAGREAQAA